MDYTPRLQPFGFHRLTPHDVVAISESGDYAFLSNEELDLLTRSPLLLELSKQAECKAKHFLTSAGATGQRRLLASRVITKKKTIARGPSLHIVVPTLWCQHSCQYCQISRKSNSLGYSMSEAQIDSVCRSIFESPSETLTVEFQGGDPLLRFDLIERAIRQITEINSTELRNIRFVVASTLHQITPEMCGFFKDHGVYLSTSIDGPPDLHNRNRPLPSRDSFQRTVMGMNLCHELIGPHSVAALMTTTRASLDRPEEIVDEYVKLGLREIFIRPLSTYGFAKRRDFRGAYGDEDFLKFYQRALDRVLHWNAQGVDLLEVSAAIALNKILSPFDSGYVDLQNPTGAGLATLVYNYDGYMYPSDEARMLAEMGNTTLRIGAIGDPLSSVLQHPALRAVITASLRDLSSGCQRCAFNPYCGPDPVNALSTAGAVDAPIHMTGHCRRYLRLFSHLFSRLKDADPTFLSTATRWAYGLRS